MTGALDGAVELLERSLAFTSAALDGVDDSPRGNLAAPTPCARWDLARLLTHMDDGLDAFTDAAAGVVVVHQAPATPSRVETLRTKACLLLSAWRDGDVGGDGDVVRRGPVGVGTATMAAPLLVATAALEITVHGWDVAQATAHPSTRPARIPADLAAGLLGLAQVLVDPSERGRRFAAPLETVGRADPDERLLAFLGRRPLAAAGDHRFWEVAGLRA